MNINSFYHKIFPQITSFYRLNFSQLFKFYVGKFPIWARVFFPNKPEKGLPCIY